MEKAEQSCCGIICNDCDWFKGEKEPRCPGCEAVKGKPFWGSCETYSCVKIQGVDHCGLCTKFPCNDFMNRYDPRHGKADAVQRAGLLAFRRMHGDEATEKLTREVQNEKPDEP